MAFKRKSKSSSSSHAKTSQEGGAPTNGGSSSSSSSYLSFGGIVDLDKLFSSSGKSTKSTTSLLLKSAKKSTVVKSAKSACASIAGKGHKHHSHSHVKSSDVSVATAASSLSCFSMGTGDFIPCSHSSSLTSSSTPTMTGRVTRFTPITGRVTRFTPGDSMVREPSSVTASVSDLGDFDCCDVIDEEDALVDDGAAGAPNAPPSSSTTPQRAVIRRNSSTHFMRTADLLMDDSVHSSLRSVGGGSSSDGAGSSIHSLGLEPHYHTPSKTPPPGAVDLEHGIDDEWIALDDGDGSHAPVAPYAVDGLARSGLKSALCGTMWTPGDSKTKKILQQRNNDAGNGDHWAWGVVMCGSQLHPLRVADPSHPSAKDILVWFGTFSHGLYGSDLPAVRSAGVVNMSPRALADLLIDSSRVGEYNKLALGREDLWVIHDGLDVHDDEAGADQSGVQDAGGASTQLNLTEDLAAEGPGLGSTDAAPREGAGLPGPFGRSITKVIRSSSKPPLMRKTLQFTSLMHLRELPGGSSNGYLLVTRAVTQTGKHAPSFSHNILHSEILMGVNVLRAVENDPDRCVMINVSHLRSPMVPTMMAKKIGLGAAANFINDIRNLC